jgi:CheY-like chemotaxis protein
VRDEGPGLSEEDRARLFGAFQRLSSRPTGGERSTGLGLAITQRIVAAHDGAIEVESSPGGGSTFTVVLPAAEGGPAPGELKRILLVDDDEDIREIAQLTLESVGGFEVTSCASGEEALEALESFAADLVILDVEMPGMDGPATLAAMGGRVPVIFLTARAAQEADRFRELGALDVIPKPFDPMELPGQVRSIWSGGQGRSSPTGSRSRGPGPT